MKWIERKTVTRDDIRKGIPWITKQTINVEVNNRQLQLHKNSKADLKDSSDLKLIEIPKLSFESKEKYSEIPVYTYESSPVEEIYPDDLDELHEPRGDGSIEEMSDDEIMEEEGQKNILYSYSPSGYKTPQPPDGIAVNRIRLLNDSKIESAIPVKRLESVEKTESEVYRAETPLHENAVIIETVSSKEESDEDPFRVCDDSNDVVDSLNSADEAIASVVEEETENTQTAIIPAKPVAVRSPAPKAIQAVKAEEEIEEDIPAEKVFEEIPINESYIIPMSFLNTSPRVDRDSWESEIRKNSELLVKTLNDFGIESRVSCVNRGPVVTLYEMTLAPGIKVTRIVSLADDIALALAAARVRVVAPIPGKSAIGIEVPNGKREMVTLGDILNTNEYRSSDMMLKIAMGKDILGKPVSIDLKKQPHLLIAGATGAGKSVCVNCVITSLVYNYDPNHLRFIMIDPKMVELQLYNGLPHMLTPVITDPDDAPKALKWAILEMERRYKLLSERCVRDIDRYNNKIASMKHPEEFEHLPYIVIIIDEFADLMMVAPKEVENYVTRIAQKARAVGIHVVLATQRPSVDIITGIIKANFPARVAFQVAQKTDSRTILDQNGAEKLLGKGDMLYQSPTSSFPVRIQGAFISEDEIMEVVQRACKYARPHYIDFEELLKEHAAVEDESGDIEDEMFVEALRIIEETKKASASYLQRRLSIGYNRAARMVEKMEEMGYVGPQQGSKPRDVYV